LLFGTAETEMVMDVCELAEPVLQELLAATAVLPEQYGPQGPGHPCGERALMWAVLADGIECYRQNAHPASMQQAIEFEDAERWVWTTDWDWPFSFVNLCEAFGFDPAAVRQALQAWRGGRRAFRRQRFRQSTLRAA
jgi:hypothetical protein